MTDTDKVTKLDFDDDRLHETGLDVRKKEEKNLELTKEEIKYYVDKAKGLTDDEIKKFLKEKHKKDEKKDEKYFRCFK